jgi:PKD repeat protein
VGNPTGGVWSGTGVTGNLFNPSVGTQTLTYTYTDGNSCVNSDVTTITVNPMVLVSVSIEANANPVCAGTSVTFTATPTGGGATPVYQWYNGATPVGTNSPGYAYVPDNGDVISVVMTSSETCITGNPLSNAITMTVNPLATAGFVADNLNPAPNTDVVFTDLSTGTANSWLWSFNPANVIYVGGTDANSQNPHVQFTTSGIYSITLTVNGATCPNTLTQTDYIHAGTPGLWTGNTSIDWNTPSNWDNYIVPTTLTDIVIPSSALFWPTFTGNLTVGTSCKSLTLSGPASQLTITGNMTAMDGYPVNNQGNIIIKGL